MAIEYAADLFAKKEKFKIPTKKAAAMSAFRPPPRAGAATQDTPTITNAPVNGPVAAQSRSREPTASPTKSAKDKPKSTQPVSRAHTLTPAGEPAGSKKGRSSQPASRAQTISPTKTIPCTPSQRESGSRVMSFANTTISSGSFEIPLTQVVRDGAISSPTKYLSRYLDGSDSDGNISTPNNTSTPHTKKLDSDQSVSSGSESVPNSQPHNGSKGNVDSSH